MLMFGMRLGADPRTVVTTTPRPAKLIRDLLCDPICVDAGLVGRVAGRHGRFDGHEGQR